MVTGILAYFSTKSGAVPLVRSTFTSFPGFLYPTVLALPKKERLLGQEDCLSTAGIAKEPSHANPNNELAALRNSILYTCENVLTVISYYSMTFA